MFTDPVTLIDQTIENLYTLSALFADETDERTHPAPQFSTELSLDARRWRDAQRAIAWVIPKLQAARAAQQQVAMAGQMPMCLNCD
jgi:hypothetical protein